MEDAVRKIRKQQPELGRLARFRHDKPRPTERRCQDTVKLDRILPDMCKRCKDGGEIGSVLIQNRAGDRETGVAKRRRPVGTKTVEEAPVVDNAAEGSNLGEMAGIPKERDRGFRGQGFVRIILHPSCSVADGDARTGTSHHRHCASTGFDGQFFGFDLRLQRESGRRRRTQPCLDMISECDGALLVDDLDLETDSSRPIGRAA